MGQYEDGSKIVWEWLHTLPDGEEFTINDIPAPNVHPTVLGNILTVYNRIFGLITYVGMYSSNFKPAPELAKKKIYRMEVCDRTKNGHIIPSRDYVERRYSTLTVLIYVRGKKRGTCEYIKK